jgi:S-adenosylmethionine:tRNA ribosyltransferase-isomerase
MSPVRNFRTSDFDYSYPPSAVAQHPLEDRSASRLLVLTRATGAIRHLRFRDFPSLLAPGDVLVRNVSRVLPARLRGTRENGREAEVLLVRPDENGTWLAMVHPGGKLKVGRRVRFGDDATATVVAVLGGGLRRLAFEGLPVDVLMTRRGEVPLPPYITRAAVPADADRYQTVYAREPGSVAAPTAGLHFTESLLGEIRSAGVAIADVTLHVGPGTFKPVETEEVARHSMHAEWYRMERDAMETIRLAKQRGHRVWAVGTTAARVLETVAGALRPATASPQRSDAAATLSGWTDLFIYPPYEFKLVDALLTNFHLPRSTLLMLVAAFGGHDRTMAGYREAVAAGYRLYSYGDAMAIV